ncbi:hypothetical protein DSM112329_03745 [Paraconexibacter sp. AEG42_29]|uniref:Uncharacterized protein n=1 Tax=Paraconexibacter sp. AEG42_29 TaxID=2997339 RepID=A0AAU7AYS7_9ACTN
MSRLLAAVAAIAALLAVLAGGIWLFGAVVAGSTAAAVVLVGAWFAVVGLATEAATRRRSSLRMVLRIAFVTTTVVLLGAGAYTSTHETTVNEALDTGPPASRAAPAAVDDLLAPQP